MIVSNNLTKMSLGVTVKTAVGDNSVEELLVVRLVLLQGGRCWTLPDAGPKVLYAAIADQPPQDKRGIFVFNYNPAAEGQISEGGPHTVATLTEIARIVRAELNGT